MSESCAMAGPPNVAATPGTMGCQETSLQTICCVHCWHRCHLRLHAVERQNSHLSSAARCDQPACHVQSSQQSGGVRSARACGYWRRDCATAETHAGCPAFMQVNHILFQPPLRGCRGRSPTWVRRSSRGPFFFFFFLTRNAERTDQFSNAVSCVAGSSSHAIATRSRSVIWEWAMRSPRNCGPWIASTRYLPGSGWPRRSCSRTNVFAIDSGKSRWTALHASRTFLSLGMCSKVAVSRCPLINRSDAILVAKSKSIDGAASEG